MPSPYPKPADQRRNRNPKQAGDWIVLDSVYEGPIPPLPAIYRWSKDTQRWWNVVWRSPMATQWEEQDIDTLALLAMARQKLIKGETRLLKEVRDASNEFGLSPKGRQMRRWVITEKDAERAGISLNDEVSDLREERAKRIAGG